jgi:hypothetical protein
VRYALTEAEGRKRHHLLGALWWLHFWWRHVIEVIDDGCIELSTSTSLAGALGLIEQVEMRARQANYVMHDVAVEQPQGVVTSDTRVDADSDSSRDDFEATEGRSFGIIMVERGWLIGTR